MLNFCYKHFGKRLLDAFLSLLASLLCFPLVTAIGMLVRLKLGSPILYRQKRPGLYGQPFVLLKFRTMVDIFDPEGNPLPDEKRLTGFGRWMRSTSLDELPEFFNVLRGDMSLVGPRPLLMQYLERYTPEQARRHSVKPGITGWAQINGRNALTWEQKFEHDIWYVDHQSLGLDLKILAITLWKIIKREGINQPGQATAEEFQGTIFP